MLLLDPLIIGNGIKLHISRLPVLFELFVSCKDTYKRVNAFGCEMQGDLFKKGEGRY